MTASDHSSVDECSSSLDMTHTSHYLDIQGTSCLIRKYSKAISHLNNLTQPNEILKLYIPLCCRIIS